MIRRVLADGDVVLVGLDELVEQMPVSAPLDLGPWAAPEVLVVTADEELLAEAGRLGVHRLVAADPEATVAATLELCQELGRA